MAATHTGQHTAYTLRTPPATALVERANAQEYQGGSGPRMRFELFDGELYSSPAFFAALRQGRMLIATQGFDPWLQYHDVSDHMLTGLALSGELVEALSNTAAMLVDNPTAHPESGQKDAATLQGEFMKLFDKRMYAENFISFMNQDEAELKKWATMLATDVQTVRGYAARARRELRQLRPIHETETFAQKAKRFIGHLSLNR